MDEDIAMNLKDYPRINEADPNIDFRRVKNQYQFFLRSIWKTLQSNLYPMIKRI